jgi:hypothetical protein
MAIRKTRSRRTTRRATTRRTTPRRSAKRGGSPWTRQEIAFLRKNYRKNETAWVARKLGRTVYSVRYKASDLKIRKANPSTWKAKPATKKSTRMSKPRRKPASRTRWAKKPARRTTRKAISRKSRRR